MEDKKLHISVSTILLIIAIIIIIIMGCTIYTLLNSKEKADKEIEQLKSETKNMQTTLSTIQNYLNNSDIIKNTNENINNQNITANETIITTENNVITNTQKTEKEEVEEIVKAFVKAVNEKDWNSVEKYSDNYVVSELKKYNVSNMSIDLSTLEKNPNNPNEYYCYDSYDIDYNGLTLKDLSLGKLFCIDKVNDIFVVTTFYATSL